jgi:outer membrane protein TolC
MNRRLLLVAGLCAALTFLLGAAPPPATAAELDLARAVDLALAQNPALKAVEERQHEVLGGVREVKADAFPQLAFVSGWNMNRNPSFLNSKDFASFIDQFPGGTFVPQANEFYGLAVELTQPVFTFGKLHAAIDLAKLVVEVVDEQSATARLDTALGAAEAYFGVLAARRGLATLELQQELRRQSVQQVQDRYDVGEATELERLRAQAALAAVAPEVARLKGQVALAEDRLRQVLSLAADEPLTLDSREAALPDAPAFPDLLAMAREKRPELANLRLQQEVLAQRKLVTRAEGKPQIDLSGAYGREVRLLENLDDPLYANWRVGLNLRWSFFDSGRRGGRIAQFESQRQQLAYLLADLERRIELEIREGLTAYDTSRARLAASISAAAAAREAARVARANYEEGLALLTDLLDAQRFEIEAEVLEVAAYYDAQVTAARLSRALGLLPTAVWPAAATTTKATEN